MIRTYEPPVPFDQTDAFGCRWADTVAALWPDLSVLWEAADNDYQGSASVLGVLPGGGFLLVEWSWGSCSGCDGYEDMSDGEREGAFLNNGEEFGASALRNYGKNLPAETRETLKRAIGDIIVNEATKET